MEAGDGGGGEEGRGDGRKAEGGGRGEALGEEGEGRVGEEGRGDWEERLDNSDRWRMLTRGGKGMEEGEGGVRSECFKRWKEKRLKKGGEDNKEKMR